MDPVQVATLIAIVLCLAALVVYHTHHRQDWQILIPVYLYLIHEAAFYICALWFRSPFFSFTHWSSWLRLQEAVTFLLVLVGVILQRRKIVKFLQNRGIHDRR